MPTIDELTARLEALEQIIAAPRAAVPPIAIGELTDVPAPGSPIASAWSQEVTNRIRHRFATFAALNAGWPAVAGNKGAHAVALDTLIVYTSNGAAWIPTPGYTAGAVALAGNVVAPGGGFAVLQVYRFGMFGLVEGYVQVNIPMTADVVFTSATAPVGFRPSHDTTGICRYAGATGAAVQIAPATIIAASGFIQSYGPAQATNQVLAFSIPFVAA